MSMVPIRLQSDSLRPGLFGHPRLAEPGTTNWLQSRSHDSFRQTWTYHPRHLDLRIVSSDWTQRRWCTKVTVLMWSDGRAPHIHRNMARSVLSSLLTSGLIVMGQHSVLYSSTDSGGKPCICIEIYYYITAVKTIDFYCYNRGKL